MSNLNETTTLCRGCLATDRALNSIENYYHVYQKIIEDSVLVKTKNEEEMPLMCWECTASMKNFENFRKKVLEADLFFSSLSGFQVKTLSTLGISTKQDVMYEEYNDEKIIPDIVPSNNYTYDVKIELKEEPIDYSPTHDYDNYLEPLHFNDYVHNNDLEAENLKMKSSEHNSTKVKSKRRVLKRNYKVIYRNTNIRMYETKQVDEKEMAQWIERDKTRAGYKKSPFKCEICITAFAKKKHYLKHVKTFHDESTRKYVCDICNRRFATKFRVYHHIKLHYTKFICKLCDYECYHNEQIDYHILCSHKRSVECLKCGMRFTMFPHFHEHYRRLHKHFTCDYCGKNRASKAQLIQHIRKHHLEHRCKPCNKTYKSLDALVNHNNFQHVKSARELCFCVECNIQFDNVARYTRHIKMNINHRQKREIPCPECGKVYGRRHSMINHYNFAHLKKTKFYCQPCDRYFLNGYKHRHHIASVHDKVPPVKNKMCPYCSRGFSSNGILKKHIFTHTGERPFKCDHCPAAFTQKHAMMSHTRSIHKIFHSQ